MNRANHPFGSPPPEREPVARRPGESHARLGSAHPIERRPAPQRLPPAAEPAARHHGVLADNEEPRTGVVRRIDASRARARTAPARSAETGARRADSRAPSAPVQPAPARPGAAPRDTVQQVGARHDARAWRCLEWGQPQNQTERRPRRDPKVTIAQLSAAGELLRHHGPDPALPQTGEFMHKMATLIAQGFGFVRCHSVCLKAPSAALSVSEVGAKVIAISGPLRAMNNVLTRAGLQ